MDKETLSSGMAQFSSGHALRPDYDPASLSWLLAKADQLAGPGAPQKVALRNADGELVGWLLYE